MPFNPVASIKGKEIGADANRVLIAEQGLVYGKHRVVSYFDDFMGDLIADEWAVNKGSDGAAANFAILSGQANGVLRATTGAGAGGNMAANGVLLEHLPQWKANMDNLEFEARVRLSAITNISLFVGFSDQVGTLEAPIVSAASDDDLTTNATDAVGFLFDTAMANDQIWLCGVKNNTDATAQNSGIAPAANTWIRLKMQISAPGTASFYINGARVGTELLAAVTPTVALTPVVSAFTLTAASATVDVDYIDIAASRA